MKRAAPPLERQQMRPRARLGNRQERRAFERDGLDRCGGRVGRAPWCLVVAKDQDLAAAAIGGRFVRCTPIAAATWSLTTRMRSTRSPRASGGLTPGTTC